MASAAGTVGVIGHHSLLGIRREHIINMLDGNSLFQVSIALHPSAPAGGIHSDGSPAPYLETTICSIANPFFSAASKLVFSFGEGSLIDRSEERRVGKECVSQCRSRESRDQSKKHK